tara:strand:+ start:163 stop:570 length:408 start_codon:yes stop_codon:yes gene_type:complete
MQSITITGRLGKNAETRTTQGGDNVCSFSVACDNGKDRNGNKRDSTWYDASLWGKRGDALCQYLTKGSIVSVTGRPTVRVYNDKAYMGVSVNEITMHGGGNQNPSQSGSNSSYDQASPKQDAPRENFDLDDEIPF